MMARDVMAGPVCETHEAADRTGRAEKAPDDHADGGPPMSGHATGLPERQVVAMKTYHDIVAARISHRTREATYGTGF